MDPDTPPPSCPLEIPTIPLANSRVSNSLLHCSEVSFKFLNIAPCTRGAMRPAGIETLDVSNCCDASSDQPFMRKCLIKVGGCATSDLAEKWHDGVVMIELSTSSEVKERDSSLCTYVFFFIVILYLYIEFFQPGVLVYFGARKPLYHVLVVSVINLWLLNSFSPWSPLRLSRTQVCHSYDIVLDISLS